MESKHTVDEVISLVQSHIDDGKSIKAQTYLAHCTQLRIRERKDSAKGLAPLKAEHITNTDLHGINKAGCSIGTTALVLVCFCLYKLVA